MLVIGKDTIQTAAIVKEKASYLQRRYRVKQFEVRNLVFYFCDLHLQGEGRTVSPMVA